jgi:hypothetical protein
MADKSQGFATGANQADADALRRRNVPAASPLQQQLRAQQPVEKSKVKVSILGGKGC